MNRRALNSELRWLLLFVGASLAIGYSLGILQLGLIIGLGLYILRVLFLLSQLERWIDGVRRSELSHHDFNGVWSEIAEDVTLMRKRYQKDKLRLQAVVTRVQEMTSALTDGVVLIDSKENMDWWNDAAFRLFGFREIDRGHKITNILRHPKFIRYFDSGNYEEPIRLESIRRESQHLEFQVHTFGAGERLVVIRDVTRVSKLEQMRKDFVANVSHELRTPLTVIRGYVETLADSADLSPMWKRALDQMQEQGHRMTALISDLITLSRLETDVSELSPSPVVIEQMLKTIAAEAEILSAEKQQSIQINCEHPLAILGEERELHSALSNLVVNAVKYSDPNTTIDIDVHQNNEGCSISVYDHGPGIDPKHIPRLTERFYRVDDDRATETGGTGLGLAIVKHVLIRHEASLRINSTVGKGSCFRCSFPAHRVQWLEKERSTA